MTDNSGEGKVPALTVRDGKVYANSRDVAAFFEKRHDNVLRDIDNLLKNMNSSILRSSMFAESAAPDGQGIDRRTYNMTRDGFALLAMGFTGEKALAFKIRYVEQFNMMEERLRNPAPAQIDVRDPSQLSRIAIQLIELNRELQDDATRLQAEVKAMAPDVAAYRLIANTDGLHCLTEAAKVLGQQPKAFNRWLTVNRYVYRRPGGSLLAYQDRIQSGILEHKLALYRKPDGSDGSRDQVMVTRRGLAHFAKKLGVALPDDLFSHSIAAE